jgi:hypothetical protein
MEKEEWKTIEDYPDYMISNLGNVKSLKNGKEKILKQEITNNGYCRVELSKDRKRKKYLVHRLVTQTFIPNPQNLPCVNHKDENKTNNCVNNLESCDAKYNNNYGTRNERSSKKLKGRVLSQETKEKLSIAIKGRVLSQEWKNKLSKAHQKPILQFNREGTKILGKWDSALQVERELNIFATNITQCLKGKYKSAKGYKWKYLEDYINEQINYLNELKTYRNRLYDILQKAS